MHGPSCPWQCPLSCTFDIDGTLIENVGKHRFNDADALLAGSRPIAAACGRVRDLVDAGVQIAFVTRRDGSFLRPATLQQLREYVHPGIRDDQVHMIPVWEGYAHAAAWTTNLLQRLQPRLHVGDHEQLDRQPAAAAGVPFLHADALARGDPLPSL